MSDDEFRALADSIKRHIWGFRVARITDTHTCELWASRPSLSSRLYDRFEPIIKIAAAIAIAIIGTVIIAAVFVAIGR